MSAGAERPAAESGAAVKDAGSPATPRVALWGAGVMAGAHAAACAALGWRIVGVSSRRIEHAAALGAQIGAPAMSSGDLLALGDAGGVDLAIVSTPPADHLGAATGWATVGVPTVISTPLCHTLDEADALVELATGGGPPLLFASNLAVAPAVQALFARVGGIGAVTSMHGRSIRGAPTRGGFTTGDWGGGVLLHPGVHQVTLMLLTARVAGLGAPTAVAARIDADAAGAVDERARVEVMFGDQLTAYATVSWRGADQPSWDFQVAGDTGVLFLDMDPRPRLEHSGELVPTPVPRATPRPATALAEAGLLAQLDAFWTGCRAGRRPVLNMNFGREVLEVTAACYWSGGRSGAATTLPFDGPRDRSPLELWRSG